MKKSASPKSNLSFKPDDKALYVSVSMQSSPEEFALRMVRTSKGLGARELADQLRSRFKLPDKKTARALVQAMVGKGVLWADKSGRLMAR